MSGTLLWIETVNSCSGTQLLFFFFFFCESVIKSVYDSQNPDLSFTPNTIVGLEGFWHMGLVFTYKVHVDFCVVF